MLSAKCPVQEAIYADDDNARRDEIAALAGEDPIM